MQPWNVVVTCRRNGERGAAKELRFFGRFHTMGFRDVLVGSVEDRARFFEELRKGKEVRDPVWRYLSGWPGRGHASSMAIQAVRREVRSRGGPCRDSGEGLNQYGGKPNPTGRMHTYPLVRRRLPCETKFLCPW